MASYLRRALNGAIVAAGISLSGCGFLFPELDFPIDAISEQGIGPVIIAILADGTERYGGGQGMHCAGGRYAGGGDKNSEDDTKKALEKRADSLKNDIKEMNRASDQCKGKTKSTGAYDQAAGCDRGSQAALIGRMSGPGASGETEKEFHAADANCMAADRAAAADPCSEGNNSARQAARDRRAADLQDAESQRKRFDDCAKDRERQAGPAPTVSPGFVVTPGMFSRPPSRRQQEPSHGGKTTTTPPKTYTPSKPPTHKSAN